MVGVESRDPRSATISMKISNCITCLLVVYFCYFSNFFSFYFNFFTLYMIACHGYITFSLLFSLTIMSYSFVFSAPPTHTPLLSIALLCYARLYSPLLCFQLLCFTLLYSTLLYSTLKPLHLSVTHSPHRHVSAEDRYICQTHNTANKFRLHFA